MLGYILAGMILVAFGFILFSPMLKGYRTQIWSGLVAFVGAAVPFLTQIVGSLQELDWRQYVLAGDRKNLTVLAILAAIAVVTSILRIMTSGKVGEK